MHLSFLAGLVLSYALLLQSMASNSLGLPFPQAASMALCSMQSAGSGQLPQPNGFTPQYAQQLHNQLLMQQGGLPFLNPGTCSEEKAPSILQMSHCWESQSVKALGHTAQCSFADLKPAL